MSEITESAVPLDPVGVEAVESPPTEIEELPEGEATEPELKGVGKRIKELTDRAKRAEEQSDHWRMMAETNAVHQTPAPAAQPAPTLGEEPKAEQFADYGDYTRALVKWEARQIVAEQQAESRQQAERDRVTERQTTFQQRAATYEASMPDFRAVAMNPLLPVTEAMAEAIQTSEKGPELLYHLGKNPKDAARISMLPPLQAAVELGRLEVRLSLPQPRRNSNAPEPVNTLTGGPGPAITDGSKLSGDEWARQRNRELMERNSRK